MRLLLSFFTGLDIAQVGITDKRINISSVTIVAIAVIGVLIILILIDFLCFVTLRMGIFAMLCRKNKKTSDSEEEKFGR